MEEETEPLLVISNLPDRDSAQALAQAAVEQHLAACVNVMAPCGSVYRWQGRLESATEIPVLFKTTRDRYPGLEALIRARHPYELPEVIAIPIRNGLPAYLDWVVAETRPATQQ